MNMYQGRRATRWDFTAFLCASAGGLAALLGAAMWLGGRVDGRVVAAAVGLWLAAAGAAVLGGRAERAGR